MDNLDIPHHKGVVVVAHYQEKTVEKPAGIESIQMFATRGPWKTKAGGELTVLFALPLKVVLGRFFVYDEEELKRVPEDITGLRPYPNRHMPKGHVGGGEFHRLRQEIVFGLEGSLKWECEDLRGAKLELILTPERGLWMPPYILHSYEVLEDKSGIIVIANTLFNPDDPRTHDTYSRETFRELQRSER